MLSRISLLNTPLMVCALIAFTAGSALGQESVDIDRVVPGFDRHSFLMFQGTYVPGPGRWNAGVHLDYVDRPLVLRTGAGDEFSIIDHRLRADLRAQVGALGRLAFAVNLPFLVYQSGDVSDLRSGGASLSSASPGDPRLVARYRFFGEDSQVEREFPGGPGLAALVAMTVPIGEHDGFVNEGGVTTDVQLLADFHVLGIGAGVMLGWKHRFQQALIAGTEFADELSLGLGLKIPVPWVRGMGAQLGFMMVTHAASPFDGSSRTASEGQLAVTYTRGDFAMRLGVGRGFNDGVGTPRVRGFASLDWAPRVRDADGDGIPDDRDECGSPEDYDGFEDSDGCRDPDNDGDLILDAEDACPNEAAEEGRDEDEDGCTDAVQDADSDGVEDAADACPNTAEDADGHEDADGCPDLDNDADDLPDSDDQCPNEPEDRDDFADDDGCPDLDNDEDGVPDERDQCPLDAEDLDEHQDEDGCPDLDHDHDGVVDTEDECPTTSETINGRSDDDGCPDRGRGVWRSSGQEGGGAFELSGTLRLSEDGTIPRASRRSIAQLARHLIAVWPMRVRLRIAGSPELSTSALRSALTEAGAPMSRVEIVADPELRRGRSVLETASHTGG